MARETEYVEVVGLYQKQTDKAVLLWIDGLGDRWIPKSLIDGWDDNQDFIGGDEIELMVAEWFVEKEGLD